MKSLKLFQRINGEAPFEVWIDKLPLAVQHIFINILVPFVLLNPYAYSDPGDYCINIVCEKPIRDEISCRDTPPSEDTNETGW